MRKRAMSIEEAKAIVTSFTGVPVVAFVNKGRKRIVRYEGEITDLYPSVFTLKIRNDKHLDMLSCSYSDVICGDIRLQPAKGGSAER